MTNRTLTVEVEDSQYPGLLTAIATFLEHAEQYKGEPEPTRENRRAWTEPGADAAATETLLSVTTDAWPMLDVLMERPATPGDLEYATGLAGNYIRVYHRLFGKQAWRKDQRDNPIQTRRTKDGVVEMYMRPEAITVFAPALAALRGSK